jgi:hypothetical protein
VTCWPLYPSPESRLVEAAFLSGRREAAPAMVEAPDLTFVVG